MKNLKNAILLLFCTILAATTLTSCLSDDKDNNDSNIITLSGAQRQQTLLSLAGDYSGYLYFYNNSEKDSVEVDWNVSSTDSTFKCFSFPISFLKYYVTTNSKHQGCCHKCRWTNSYRSSKYLCTSSKDLLGTELLFLPNDSSK